MFTLDFNHACHLHFIGIGGISMSGLAEVLLGAGFTITGSDMQDSAIITRLREKGARITIGHAKENLHPVPDAIVYTAAIHPDNPEYVEGQALGLPFISRAALLGQMMDNYRETIAIAGTHGKTTTTSMAAHVLLAGALDPTVSVGGMLPAIGGNIRVGQSEVFLTEACEYTNSFLTLRPKYGLILNVDADHLDFFKDLDAIACAFHEFARGIVPGGTLLIAKDCAHFDLVTADLSARIRTVALAGDADYSAAEVSYDKSGCATFRCLKDGKPFGEYTLHVPGAHNVMNALFAIALGAEMGLSSETIAQGLAGFSGTDRRFEYKGTMHDVTVVDDYAHHPTEIRATLSTAKQFAKGDVWVAFQPHTYSRTEALLDDFAAALSLADHIVLAEIYAAREQNTSGISSKHLSDALCAAGKDAHFFETFSEIEDYLRTSCRAGDLLITMGAGNITELGPMLVR